MWLIQLHVNSEICFLIFSKWSQLLPCGHPGIEQNSASKSSGGWGGPFFQVRLQQKNPWVYWAEPEVWIQVFIRETKCPSVIFKLHSLALKTGIIGLFYLHAYTPQNVQSYVQLWVNMLSSDLHVTYRESPLLRPNLHFVVAVQYECALCESLVLCEKQQL